MKLDLLNQLRVGVVVRCIRGDAKFSLKKIVQVSGAVFDYAWGHTDDDCPFETADEHSRAVYDTMLEVTSCKYRADPSHLKIELSTTLF